MFSDQILVEKNGQKEFSFYLHLKINWINFKFNYVFNLHALFNHITLSKLKFCVLYYHDTA